MVTSGKVAVRSSALICGVFMLELTGFGDCGRLGPTATPSETGRSDWPVLITLRLIPRPPAQRRRRFCQRTDEQTPRAWQQRFQEAGRNKDGYFYIAAGRTDQSHKLKFSWRNRQPQPLHNQPRVPKPRSPRRTAAAEREVKPPRRQTQAC